jgi:hypothetical protein
MPGTAARKFNLVDGMILVAATGFSLSCYVLLDNAVLGGQRYIYGLFARWPSRWNFFMALDRATAVSTILLPLVGGWTLVLPILCLRNSRGSWRRLGRQSGVLASLAAIAGMVLCAVVAGSAFLLSWWIDGTPLPPSRSRGWVILLDRLVFCTGLSVAAVWLTQAMTGRWRRSADWLDRLGRCVGGLWLVAGLVFAVRSLY